MTLGEPEQTEPQLKSGELDLVLGFGSRFTQEDGIERHFLLEDPMLLVLPREHPLAKQAQPAPAPTSPTRRGSAARRTASATG